MGQAKGKTGKGVSLKPMPEALERTRDTGAAALKLVADTSSFREFSRGPDGAPVVIYRRRDRTWADTVTKALTEWLDWLLHRDLITADMWDAGDKLREMHHIAFGSGYATVNMDGTGGGGPGQGSSKIGDTRHRYMAIHKQFQAHDRIGWAIAEGVCCHGKSAKEAARGAGLRGRDGTETLRRALDDLSHWFRKGRLPVKAKQAHEGPVPDDQ